MTSKQKILQLAIEGSYGKLWYPEALADIDLTCCNHGWDTIKFVVALAVLSPQVSVRQNIKLTLLWFLYGIYPRVLPSVAASFDRAKDSQFALSSIRGPKTRRFAHALLGDEDAVVLDTHMGHALNVPAAKLRNKSVQTEAEKRIGWVARTLGWSPAQVQAAVWTAQRARAGYYYSSITLEPVLEEIQS
jgi:hypothetical protein